MKFMDKVEIIDTTLRDGLQNQEKYVDLNAKKYILDGLLESGIKRIEVGSLSHVKYVPQFKDIDDFLRIIPKREDVEYTVLALNKKAIERLIALREEGVQVDRVLTGQIATSDSYAMKNMRSTHDKLFKEAEENVKLLHDAGIKTVVGNIGTIFGCPIEGKMDINKAYDFVDRMFEIGFDQVEHSDPDGIATPVEVYNYFTTILKKYPDKNKHIFHVHDIRGTGIALYLAAIQAGVNNFETTVGSIGGQIANFMDNSPVVGAGEYYFKTKYTGLVSTEDFVTLLNDMDIDTGIDEKKLYLLNKKMKKILGRELHSLTSDLFNSL